jgi:hypothetical protein
MTQEELYFAACLTILRRHGSAGLLQVLRAVRDAAEQRGLVAEGRHGSAIPLHVVTRPGKNSGEQGDSVGPGGGREVLAECP